MTSLIPNHITKCIAFLALTIAIEDCFGQTGEKDKQVLFSYTFNVVPAKDAIAENAPVTVSGKVISKADGFGLPGARIHIKGKTHPGTQTDIEGNFTLNTQRCDELEISFIGYSTQTMTVENDEHLIISMEESPEELVVIYPGYIQKKICPGTLIKVKKRTFLGRLFHKKGDIFRHK
ncbi:MAG: carboxypeptidase-like regulatory domain-containing protein [Bacteroidia bacterium]